jgi:hypothetical protein
LRGHLEDGIPAQFVYEAADCRLYYELSMITNVTAIWKKAADATCGTRPSHVAKESDSRGKSALGVIGNESVET